MDTPRFHQQHGPGYGHMDTPRFQARRGPGYGSVQYWRNYAAGQNRYRGTFMPSFGAGSAGPEIGLPIMATGVGVTMLAAWKGFMAYQIIAPLSKGKMPPKWALWWVGTWYLINSVSIGMAGLGITAVGGIETAR